MNTIKDRTLAYDLATTIELDELENVTGGGSTIHIPTVGPSGSDLASFDMDLDQ